LGFANNHLLAVETLVRRVLEKSWSRTRNHLKDAAKCLPPNPKASDDGGSLELFEDWLKHNELENALDELELLGEANESETDSGCTCYVRQKKWG
jgi:hypothetical protein